MPHVVRSSRHAKQTSDRRAKKCGRIRLLNVDEGETRHFVPVLRLKASTCANSQVGCYTHSETLV